MLPVELDVARLRPQTVTTNSLNFQNSNYQILENIRSGIGEWNSIVGNSMSNSLIVGYTIEGREPRAAIGALFPFVDILDGTAVAYTSFGSEPFTPNNELRYKTFQMQDNFTKFGNKHTLTFGGSLERYESENVFFPGSQSVYVYNSLADFYADAQRLPRQSEPHDLAGDAAPLPGALQQHPRPGQAGPAARGVVQRRATPRTSGGRATT